MSARLMFLLVASALVMAGCGTIDKIMDRKVNYEKCVAALVAGGVAQKDAESVCKRLSENAGGAAALRGAL